jgi:hypothetical protein
MRNNIYWAETVGTLSKTAGLSFTEQIYDVTSSINYSRSNTSSAEPEILFPFEMEREQVRPRRTKP